MDRFLFWEPLLSVRFRQKGPRGSTAYSKVFMGLQTKENAPTDRARQFKRIGFWRDRFANVGQYLLSRSQPGFPPGAIAQGLGHLPRAIRDRTPLASTPIA